MFYQGTINHDEATQIAHAMTALAALEPTSDEASLVQQILSAALQGGFQLLLKVLPLVVSAVSAKYPAVGGLLIALQAILAQINPTTAPATK